jgi:hypothetical protein
MATALANAAVESNDSGRRSLTIQQESAFSSLKLTRYQRLTGFGLCELSADRFRQAESLHPGFVVGFGVSLLGAIMLFIGFTGAFASKSTSREEGYR